MKFEIKFCSKCGEESVNFYSTSGYCINCLKKYNKDRLNKKKEFAVKYKGGSCLKCGYNDYHQALEFHHRDPLKKELTWHHLRYMKEDEIKIELDKCDLLCCRCHREIHANLISEEKIDEEYKSQKQRKENRIKRCPNCNQLFDPYPNKTLKYCSEGCSRIASRKVKNRPSKEELSDLIRDNSWISIGKKFRVSDNAVRKWAKKYNLI